MIVDLFAGPGGWSTGLNLISRREDIGIEWDEASVGAGELSKEKAA